MNKNLNLKGTSNKEMQVGRRGERMEAETMIMLSNHRCHTVLSALQYFNTNYASIIDLLVLITEVKRPLKRLTIPIFDNQLGNRTSGPRRS